MKLRKFSDVLLRVSLAYSAALSLLAVLYVHFMGGGFFYGESGILEISQSVILFCIFAYCLAVFVSFSAMPPLLKSFCLFMSVLSWAFFLRETDFDKMGLPNFMVFFLYGSGRAITIIIGFICVGILVLKELKGVSLRYVFEFCARKQSLFLFLSAILLFMGYFCERRMTGNLSEIFEEIFELLAYCSMLASAKSAVYAADEKYW